MKKRSIPFEPSPCLAHFYFPSHSYPPSRISLSLPASSVAAEESNREGMVRGPKEMGFDRGWCRRGGGSNGLGAGFEWACGWGLVGWGGGCHRHWMGLDSNGVGIGSNGLGGVSWAGQRFDGWVELVGWG
ncbi:hypothetical protein RDABS01_025494 [Bienertia sinuspersici]